MARGGVDDTATTRLLGALGGSVAPLCLAAQPPVNDTALSASVPCSCFLPKSLRLQGYMAILVVVQALISPHAVVPQGYHLPPTIYHTLNFAPATYHLPHDHLSTSYHLSLSLQTTTPFPTVTHLPTTFQLPPTWP